MRASTVEVLAYEEDKAAFNRVKKAMGVDWVKNEFHTFMNSKTSKVDVARVATPLTNEVLGVENEGAEEEVRHEAVVEEEEVRKEADFEMVELEADSEVVEPEAIAEEEIEPEAVTEDVEASNEAMAINEQRIAAIYKKEDDEDNEDED